MSLPDVVAGDPHVVAHNDERAAINAKLDKLLQILTKTGTSVTLASGDAGQDKLVVFNNSSAISAVIPLNSVVNFPVGTVVNFATSGTGQVTLSFASGVTPLGGAYKSARQGAMWSAIQIATDTWLVNGDLVS